MTPPGLNVREREVREPQADERDKALLARLKDELQATGYYPLRDLQVEVHEGLVIFRGTLGSYYQKQLVIEILLRLGLQNDWQDHIKTTWTPKEPLVLSV